MVSLQWNHQSVILDSPLLAQIPSKKNTMTTLPCRFRSTLPLPLQRISGDARQRQNLSSEKWLTRRQSRTCTQKLPQLSPGSTGWKPRMLPSHNRSHPPRLWIFPCTLTSRDCMMATTRRRPLPPGRLPHRQVSHIGPYLLDTIVPAHRLALIRFILCSAGPCG